MNNYISNIIIIIIIISITFILPMIPFKYLVLVDNYLGKLLFLSIIAFVSYFNIPIALMLSIAFLVILFNINKTSIDHFRNFREYFTSESEEKPKEESTKKDYNQNMDEKTRELKEEEARLKKEYAILQCKLLEYYKRRAIYLAQNAAVGMQKTNKLTKTQIEDITSDVEKTLKNTLDKITFSDLLSDFQTVHRNDSNRINKMCKDGFPINPDNMFSDLSTNPEKGTEIKPENMSEIGIEGFVSNTDKNYSKFF